MWAVAYDSYEYFQHANNVFHANLRSSVKAQLSGGLRLQLAYARCFWYFSAVSTVGIVHFNPCGVNPLVNRDAREKIKRLNSAIITG